ncbi:WXG100 family type VII secretion target [Streptomyces sp. CA-288835]|uniref:WXG100 family type VII secretion target n=1 Tax=Streptomyces sp. CA-288835 TaxID=3240069 RepID=UPI003D900BAD
MNFNEGFIYVDYTQVQAAVEDMEAQSQAIARVIENLNMELTELQNSWIGDDKDVYAEVQKKWDMAVHNLGLLLKNHSTALEGIQMEYARTQQSGTDRWQSVRIGSR